MSLSIGLDISKDKVDYYFNGTYGQIKNNKADIIACFKEISKDHCVVMEATGKYHRIAQRALEQMGFQVMIINPYQSKHFAKALNLLCKTDQVDAKMLSLFGEKMIFKPTVPPTEAQQMMQDLSRHLDDLKKIKVGLELRKKESTGFIESSLQNTMNTLQQEIKETEIELKNIAEQDVELKKKLNLLISIPGVAQTTAISLLSYLKELGSLSKREISALSGLAPVNNDSGLFKGTRRIRGGRHDVRSSLYMPCLGAATQHNQRLKYFYQKLIDSGKPKKVALTACMRKLVVWANAILASNTPWEEGYEQG